MSYDFDQVSDVISRASVSVGTTYSGCAWIDADDQGENDAGLILGHGPDGAERFELRWNGAAGSKKLRFLVAWSGGDARWDMTTGFTATAGVKWVGFSYNGGATTNDPTLYTVEDGVFSVLTVGSGLTEGVAPSGSLPADNQTFRIGFSPFGDQDFDGRIGEVGLWIRENTPNEMSAVPLNGVLAIPDSLYLYWPLDRDEKDYSGNGRDGTVSGATLFTTAYPPIRPAGRRG